MALSSGYRPCGAGSRIPATVGSSSAPIQVPWWQVLSSSTKAKGTRALVSGLERLIATTTITAALEQTWESRLMEFSSTRAVAQVHHHHPNRRHRPSLLQHRPARKYSGCPCRVAVFVLLEVSSAFTSRLWLGGDMHAFNTIVCESVCVSVCLCGLGGWVWHLHNYVDTPPRRQIPASSPRDPAGANCWAVEVSWGKPEHLPCRGCCIPRRKWR